MAEKLSDGMKDFLRALGGDPETFNLEVQALEKKKKGGGSKKVDNSPYYESVGRKEPIAAVAERAEAAKPPIVYLPLGYVMFERHSKCKTCGTEETTMDCPNLYLMQTDKRGSSTRLFTPVETWNNPKLPRYIKRVEATPIFCTACYEGVPHVEESLSPSGPTEGGDEAEAPPCQS